MAHSNAQRRSCLAVVLAAGEGTRMRSATPKVLHKLAGRSMLAHVLSTLTGAGAGEIAVVAPPNCERLFEEAASIAPGAQFFVQKERLGTAHAVLAAREAIAKGYDDVLAVFADTPLVRSATLFAMREALACGNNAIAALGFEALEPQGYGRLILEEGRLVAIREDKDATEAEQSIKLCNAGLMAFDGGHALTLLQSIGNENKQKEYYLTDAVAAAQQRGLAVVAVTASEDEVMGINDRAQLAAAESILQARLRANVMREGATLIAPDTVTLSFDTRLGRDTIVEPHVVFGPGVSTGEGALIRSFSYLEGATIGPRAIIGPFARLRPGARLAEDVHIGNFVEVKASEVGSGAKINHLSYVGDARIGAGTNVGAGTITCNYDGFGKYRTEIGERAFIGSNTALVAPVSIGEGAYIGSGSVITEDVASDALALGRARQVALPGWAKAFRERRSQERSAPPGREAPPALNASANAKENG